MRHNKQTILGNVPSKSNCYKIIAFNGHSSLAKTKGLKDYEALFFIQCGEYRNKMISGYFELHIKVFYPSQRSDLDNSLKIVCDCLQNVKAIKNDNKLVKIVAEKYLDKMNPRIEFELEEIDNN
jgi:Holliday junction resolvase RusA-like endonuclease